MRPALGASMRVGLVLLLALHGLLHLLGFLKPWGLAALPELGGRMPVSLSPTGERAVGLLWLVAAVAFLVAAWLRGGGRSSWWTVAAAAVVLSQLLVLLQWQDAKFGTVPNVIVAIAAVVGFSTDHFRGQVDGEVRALLAGASRA